MGYWVYLISLGFIAEGFRKTAFERTHDSEQPPPPAAILTWTRDAWMHAWMAGWMDGWMDEWMELYAWMEFMRVSMCMYVVWVHMCK